MATAAAENCAIGTSSSDISLSSSSRHSKEKKSADRARFRARARPHTAANAITLLSIVSATTLQRILRKKRIEP
jgi:hypothetical protein